MIAVQAPLQAVVEQKKADPKVKNGVFLPVEGVEKNVHFLCILHIAKTFLLYEVTLLKY